MLIKVNHAVAAKEEWGESRRVLEMQFKQPPSALPSERVLFNTINGTFLITTNLG